ncbi:MAG: trypsin-like serine protease [Saprospiraceae bacterium]|nr:trypsin-like serine protease [Saprospiraceae bacterium]
MKNTITFTVFLLTVLCQFSSTGQQPFNMDLYTPIPLQSFTPPIDPEYKENKLIMYNMMENRFDTIQTANYNEHPAQRTRQTPFNQSDPFIDQEELQPFSFSTLQPADQLAGFRDYPISAVVKLFITFFNPQTNQNSFGTCSGLMVHPSFILTGGHCVKSKFDSSYAVACTIIPAYNLGTWPFGLTTTTNWYSFSQWTQNGNLDYDIAIMSLAEPVGNQTGWIDLGFTPNDSFFTAPSNNFHSFGYPGYDSFGNPVFEAGERMYYMNGYMDFWKSTNTICHYNIGYQGQSGSGFFHQDSFQLRSAYGVLSHGSGIVPPYYTCHCRMDSMMFATFNNIIPMVSEINEEHLTNQISIYPNPTTSEFSIDFGQIPHTQIHLRGC